MSRLTAKRAILFLPLLLWPLSNAVAQGTADPPEPLLSSISPPTTREAWQTLPADSSRVLTGARSAQSRFEAIRRNHLPWTWERGGGGCDERIGRFCLWYGDGDSKWQPPPEPKPVTAARSVLIARLDTAAAVIPGDWWVAGQRVRYLVEGEKVDEAVAAARACRSRDPGWCDALLGYALHVSGEYIRADSAFGAALASMPARERERWTDLTPLLDPADTRAYRRLQGAERAAFEARYWWLADPMYMLPGNDRRTEHFSRHVLDRLQERARQTEGISWGSDLRELLIRYGWPAGWERIRPRNPGLNGAGLVTQYTSGSRHFDPPLRHVRQPLRIAADDWDLNARRARTGYAPAYATPIDELDYQLSRFRRGDSVVVLAALMLKPDSLGVRHAADAAVVFWSAEDAPPRVLHGRAEETPARFAATLPAGTTLVSLEALARDEKRAGRIRFALPLEPPPVHGLSASDLLLLENVEPLPVDLEEAVLHLRTTHEARSGERLTLFFELYGLSASDLPVAIGVNLIDDNAGWLRRTAVRAGIMGHRTPLAVRWQEAPQTPGPVYARSLVVELPELAAGNYNLELTITPRGREALVAQRRISIVE
jgi:hypothetical protein